MRELKFRGRVSKEYMNGHHEEKFFYGSLIYCPDDISSTIIDRDGEYEVLSETVGQYTGLKDKAGKEIYEGDLLLIGNQPTPVEFRQGCYFIGHVVLCISCDHREIMGNIHQNPELLK